MIRSALALLLSCGLLGCGDDAAVGPEVISCELAGVADQSAPNLELDVVLVVSDAPGMAAYRDALIANLTTLGDVLAATAGGMPSLRLTVVDAGGELTAEPRLPGCAAPDQPFVEDLDQPWFWCDDGDCRVRNYLGPLGDTLACVGTVAADGAAAPPLLARLDQALDDDAVLRPGAYLAVVLIGVDDDASPGDPAMYADRVRAGRADGSVLVARIAGPATPRLDAFLAEFPDRTRSAAIDDADWTDAFDWFLGAAGDVACLDAAALLDVDLDAAGLQPDCVAFESGGGAAIPPCLMATPDRPDPATPLPCFRVAEVPWDIGPACTHHAIVERERAGRLGMVRCACVP